MALISINKVLFKLEFVYFIFIVEKGNNFLESLINILYYWPIEIIFYKT